MDKTDHGVPSPDWLQRIAPCPRPVPAGGQPYTGQAVCRAGWTEPARVIYDHQLLLVRRGRFRVDVEGTPYDCPADTFLIIPPARVHTSWEVQGQDGHRAWVHFDWVWYGPYGQAPWVTFDPARIERQSVRSAPAFVPPGIFHGPIRSAPRAYELLERLIALQARGTRHDQLLCRARLLELLLELLDAGQRQSIRREGEAGLARSVRDLLETAVEQPRRVGVEQLLEGLGYSYAHLCRVFRRHYGVPPLRYMHMLRISRARQLLRETNWKVAKVAYSVGYRDPLYFSQLFRRLVGVPPSVYARSEAPTGPAQIPGEERDRLPGQMHQQDQTVAIEELR